MRLPVTSLPDTDGDGIPNVPTRYEGAEGRKVVEDSKNIFELIKNPNKYTIMIVAIVLIVIFVVVLIIRLVLRLIKRIRKK